MSTARGDGALPEPVPPVRATDDERLAAVTRLREAAGEGAIDLDELEQRISDAYAARTVGELALVTADLPAVPASPPARPGTRPSHRRPLVLEDDEFRGHLTTYSLVIGMLVVIWLLSGAGHPWPVYPALGWGVGLGGHYQRASTHQRKRLARATSLGITLDELELREEQERKARREEKRQRRRAQLDQERGRRRETLDQAREQRHRDRHERRPIGPPPARADEPTSRFVVAMFVDVAGSTQLNEALGDEQWATVRRSFRELVADAIAGHGGWEANCSGDGVLARFEHPSAAADAAVTILRRLDRQRTDTGFAPSVRVGIHSGDAVEEGDDIIGNVVNLAARVTDAADRDEILVTEHVADHLDGRHATEGRGLHTLKGVARPRHLLCLAWR